MDVQDPICYFLRSASPPTDSLLDKEILQVIENIKRMTQPYEAMGIKVGSHHTRCPIGDHDSDTHCSVSFGDDGTILWHCHVCNKGGTVVDIYLEQHGGNVAEAIAALEEEYGGAPTVLPPPREYIKPVQLGIPPIDAEFPPIRLKFGNSHSEQASLIDIAPFLADGELCATAVLRWDNPDGSKQIRQAHFWDGAWRFGKKKGHPTPIHRMAAIAALSPDATIFVVEGEKCMHALDSAIQTAIRRYDSFPVHEYVVTTNLGGTSAVRPSTFSIIGQRQTFVIPDNDEPGSKWAFAVRESLPNASILQIAQADDPKGFDISDWLQAGGDVRALLRIKPLQAEAPVELAQVKRARLISEAIDTASSLGSEDIRSFIAHIRSLQPDALDLDTILKSVSKSTTTGIRILKSLYNDDPQISTEPEVEHVDHPTVVAELVAQNVFDGDIRSYERNIFTYNGTHWQNQSDNDIRQICMQVTKRLSPEMSFKRCTDEALSNLKDLCHHSGPSPFSRSPAPIINTRSGELHIDDSTGEVSLHPHDPSSLLTHCLDLDYDPHATCPEYDRMVREIFCNDEDLVRHFEEIAGYIIQPSRRLKHFVLAYGNEGNNGKSSLFELVAQMCGYDRVSKMSISSFSNSPFATSNLVGKLLQIDDDMTKNAVLPDGIVKALSEQKTITVEQKFKPAFEATIGVMNVIITNHFPIVSDVSQSIRNRALVLPFERQFSRSEIDKNLKERIMANEASGVLNRFISGFQRLVERGYFQSPPICDATLNQWLGEVNPLCDFVSTRLVPGSPTDLLYAPELYQAYQSYCDEEGIVARWRSSRHKFKRELSSIGLTIEASSSNSRGRWMISGYTLPA